MGNHRVAGVLFLRGWAVGAQHHLPCPTPRTLCWWPWVFGLWEVTLPQLLPPASCRPCGLAAFWSLSLHFWSWAR